MPSLPTKISELNGWIIVLTGMYLALSYTIHGCRCYLREDYSLPAHHAKRLFDGVTFAGSIMLLIGIFNPPVLDLIENKSLYLAIAAAAGLGYSIRAIFLNA